MAGHCEWKWFVVYLHGPRDRFGDAIDRNRDSDAYVCLILSISQRPKYPKYPKPNRRIICLQGDNHCDRTEKKYQKILFLRWGVNYFIGNHKANVLPFVSYPYCIQQYGEQIASENQIRISIDVIDVVSK